MIFPKGQKRKIGRYFTTKEFDCPCDRCISTWIHPTLVERLDKIRDAVRGPVVITSGYRCSDHQSELKAQGYETASGLSTHETGWAADIVVNNFTGRQLEPVARDCGFTSIGVAKNWIHVDIRSGDREWKYLKTD